MEMHGQPVVWSEENQLTADYIYILTANNEVEQVNMETNAFIISESDSVRFNQIKGKRMIGLVENRQLVQINVYENGESLYYLKDDDDLLIGSNHITCTNMNIFLKNKQIDRIWFYEKPTALMRPPNRLSASEKELAGFRWEGKHRPKQKDDIFLWYEENLPEDTEEKREEILSPENSEQESSDENPDKGL
jgi:hypothetical protein